ncbi:MAG TPA: alpha/beta hydrolase-fold protein [Gaiellaceae bacterium]|nr:alpha/beta hydrolase-fold protein [Gaiellaceae bacterium]
MSGPWPKPPRGRLDEHVLESHALAGNPLGDPHERPLWVWTPPGYGDEGERSYPSVYVIQGFTGQLDMWRNRSAFRRNYPELVDELAPEAVVVFVDTWTSVGGSQFVDSPATGRYHMYLCDELVPWVDARYRTLAAPEHRGIQGKSSGGYGALLTALLRPELFGGIASHAGGGLFDVSIRPFFRDAARTLRDLYGGSVEAWLANFRSRPAFSRPNDIHLLLQYGFSAAYSRDGAIRLPYDLETAEVIPELWDAWLDHDFPRVLPARADAARSWRACWIDSGTRDEWFLDLTAAWLRRELGALGVRDLHFELFDATHAEIEYRYPLALRWLVERLA